MKFLLTNNLVEYIINKKGQIMLPKIILFIIIFFLIRKFIIRYLRQKINQKIVKFKLQL